MKKFIYWLSRILSILFLIFISLFAFDVFDSPQWPLALLMHLIPSFILLILIIIAWKHQRIGGFLLLIASIITAIFFHSTTIAIPVFVIGSLFVMESHVK